MPGDRHAPCTAVYVVATHADYCRVRALFAEFQPPPVPGTPRMERPPPPGKPYGWMQYGEAVERGIVWEAPGVRKPLFPSLLPEPQPPDQPHTSATVLEAQTMINVVGASMAARCTGEHAAITWARHSRLLFLLWESIQRFRAERERLRARLECALASVLAEMSDQHDRLVTQRAASGLRYAFFEEQPYL